MQTMTREIQNSNGQNEIWLDMTEAAEYIERSAASLRTALKKYEDQTGKEIVRLRDGNSMLVRQSDLNEVIKTLYPFLARKKGLI